MLRELSIECRPSPLTLLCVAASNVLDLPDEILREARHQDLHAAGLRGGHLRPPGGLLHHCSNNGCRSPPL